MKKLNIKALLTNHAEKIVFGLFALIVLGVLTAGTSWARYSKTPDELKRKIDDARKKIASNTEWPKDKQAEFAIVDFTEKARMLFTMPSIARYDFSQWLFHPLYRKDEPKREPIYEPVQDLIARSAIVPLSVMSKEAMQRNKLLASEEAETETETPVDENSEFGLRTSSTGNQFTGRPGEIPGAAGRPAGYGGPGMGAGGPRGAGHAAPGGASGGRNRPGAGLGMMPPGAAMEPGMMAGMMGGGGMSGMMGGMGSDVAARGVRMIAVRGVFPVRKQIENYKNALHINESEAADLLEITDFELQRQTAEAGPDPWKDSDEKWTTVDIQHALDVLNESSDIDSEDPVPTALRDAVITMDLPLNLLGYWRDRATHPRIKDEELSPEAIAEETRLLETLNEVVDGVNLGEDAKPRRRGLAPAQRDFRNLANRVSSDMEGRNMMEEMMKNMRGAMTAPGGMNPGMNRGASAAAMRSSAMPMAHMGPGGMPGMGRGPMMGGMPGMPGQMGGTQMIDRLVARRRYLLFRYFDFDVESGKAYRYRVRLKLRNPNFERTADELAGADMEIAKGEERETPWSNISNPDYIRPTTAYFLDNIEREPYTDDKVKATSRPVAMISMYEWNPEVGAVFSDILNITAIGSYIGETKKSTEIPDLVAGTLEKGEHTFSTQDMLVDVESDVDISPDQHPDLKLSPDRGRVNTRLGGLEKALVVTSLGELKTLSHPMDENDREDSAFWKKREAEEHAVIKSRESASPANNGPAGMMGMMGMGMPGADGEMEGRDMKRKNPRKAGQQGMMMPGMMMPGMMPGGAMPGGAMPGGMGRPPGARGKIKDKN